MAIDDDASYLIGGVRVVKVRRPTARQLAEHGVKLISEARRRRGQPKEEFQHIIEFARELAATDSRALPMLVRLLGRSLQAFMVSQAVRQGQGNAVVPSGPDDLYFNESTPLTNDGKSFTDLAVQMRRRRPMFHLDRDIVLPRPWSRERLQESLSMLRPRGQGGPWEQDDNHQVCAWLPIGIGFVWGGNHSIAAGIVGGQGTIRADVCYDVSAVFEHLRCDGENWLRICDGIAIARVASIDAAAIWEIGRMMQEHTVKYDWRR